MFSIPKQLLINILLLCLGLYTVTKILNSKQHTALVSSKYLSMKFSKIGPREIMSHVRSRIQYELFSYNFSLSGARGLNDLVMETGGEPLRSIIISTWGSGSTYIENLLNSVPGTYYHHKPLASLEEVRPLEAKTSLDTIKNLLKCNYEGLPDYFKITKNNAHFFSHNKELRENCEFLCGNASLLSKFCKLYPFQVMKIMHLELLNMAEILDDKELNVKLVLFVRDPRDVLHFRQEHELCELTTDCNASHICTEMISNHEIVDKLQLLYPDRVMVLQYGKLAENPAVVSHQLLTFLKISRSNSTDQFIQSNKELESTSKFRSVLDIQVCKEAIKLWGYKMVDEEMNKEEEKGLTNITEILV